LIAFYLIARVILYPDTFKQNYLLYIFIPVAFTGFKLSAVPFALLSIFPVVSIIRRKEYKPLIFIVSILFLYFVFWMARTVIVSGYLIYPLYEINPFAFDWQVPVETAVKQRFVINYYANEYMAETIWTGIMMHNKYYFILLFIYLAAFLSIIVSLYTAFKKKISLHKYLLATLIPCLCYWAFFARDFRFGSGYIFAVIFLGIVSILGSKDYVYPKVGVVAISLLIFWMAIFSFRSASYYNECLSDGLHITDRTERLMRMLVHPYSVKDKMAALKNGEAPGENFAITSYKLNDSVSIGVSTYPCGGWFGDNIPCMANKEAVPDFWTIPEVRQIEARGNSVKNGFRTKRNFLNK
jgi:hypothetical protein